MLTWLRWPVLALAGLVLLACAHSGKSGASLHIFDEDIPLWQPDLYLPEMTGDEAAEWAKLIRTTQERLKEQARSRTLTEEGLVGLKARISELADVALHSCRGFPQKIDSDLRRLFSRIDQAIVKLSEPQEIQVAQLPSFDDSDTSEPVLYSMGPRSFMFAWPLSKFEITSRFGPRHDPFERNVVFHDGIDLAAPKGTLIFAAERGEVVFTGVLGKAGKLVVIQHDFGFQTYYAHLSTILTIRGISVERGQPIALVGQTGRATGPHLHFKIAQYGNAVDPERYVGASLGNLN